MKEQEAWFELYKAVVASGQPERPTAVSDYTDQLFEAYKERWMLRHEAVVRWDKSKQVNIENLREVRKKLGVSGYILVLLPRSMAEAMEAHGLYGFIEPQSLSYFVEKRVIGVSGGFLFAYQED